MRFNSSRLLSIVSLFVITPFVLCYSFDEWLSDYKDVKKNLINKDIFNYNSLYVHYNSVINQDYDLDLNKFSGYNSSEFSSNFKGFTPRTFLNNKSYTPFSSFSPSTVDWRNSSIVGPIKDQQQCGSCWAFSAVSALESQVMKVLDKSVSLSEQDMVDCVKDILSPDGSMVCCDGCAGGEMYSVYQYLSKHQSGADDTEKQYPYLATDGKCHYKKSLVGSVVLKDYVALPTKDEDALEKAVFNIGPISVGVDANIDWQLYKKGIYDPDKSSNGCSSDMSAQDHGVVVVGYGSENGKNYWIIRNSWNTNWGEKGYMRLVKGKNACGVANSAIYPVVGRS
jgi:hypothetical protein